LGHFASRDGLCGPLPICAEAGCCMIDVVYPAIQSRHALWSGLKSGRKAVLLEAVEAGKLGTTKGTPDHTRCACNSFLLSQESSLGHYGDLWLC